MTHYIENKNAVVDQLNIVLANTYALYLNTQNAHWNVVGPHFHPLHQMFGEQYAELAEAIDEIAERIRALGAAAPGSLSGYAALSQIEELTAAEIKGSDALKALVNGHEKIDALIKNAQEVAAENGDEGTADMMIARLQAHEKTLWMLRNHL